MNIWKSYKKKSHKNNNQRATIILSAALSPLLFTHSANANLNNVSGMNQAQAQTAAMIQDICPRMGAIQNELTVSQNSLFLKCRSLVQTSNELDGNGGTVHSLGYDEAQLRDALQDIAHEEAATHGTVATETLDSHVANISSRMSALHNRSQLASLSGLMMNIDGVPLAYMPSTLTGGGAGSEMSTGWNMYINGMINFGEKDETSHEDGFDFDSLGITTGADIQLTEKSLVGVGLGYTQNTSDLARNEGEANSDVFSLSLYGTQYLRHDIYIDAILTVGQSDYENTRTISFANNILDDRLSSDSDGQQSSFTLGIGKDYTINSSSKTISSYAKIAYSDVSIDAYSETSQNDSALELAVKKQEINSLSSTIGIQYSDSMSFSQGVWSPQVIAEYHHQFKDEGRNIDARYVNDPFGDSFFNIATDDADENHFSLGVGASAVLANGQQFFAFYETTLGLANIENNLFTLGYRSEF